MGRRIKKLKKQRIHSEGNETLLGGLLFIVIISGLLWHLFDTKIPFWSFLAIFGVLYAIVLNFFRCPIRYFEIHEPLQRACQLVSRRWHRETREAP